MAFDPLQETLDLLSDNWTDSNTDSITPNFIKVTNQKKWDYRDNQDVVIAQRPVENNSPAGLGPTADKNEILKFNLDIRVLGSDQEDHFYKVLDEIKRLLTANKVLPFSGTISDTHVLEWNDSGPDLSDKKFNIWRKLLPVQIERYNVAR